MKLKPEQLSAHLNNNVAPVYLLYGEELLLLNESRKAICDQAQALGFTDVCKIHLDNTTGWDEFARQTQSFSLFSLKQIFELHLPTGKPGTTGSAAICNYVASLSPDNILIMICGKLEPAQQNSAWFKALDSKGVVVAHWPVDRSSLPQWITQRMKARGLTADKDAINLLAQHVDGNLLAADQEIIKLELVYGKGHLRLEQMVQAVADNAHFNLFDSIDFALMGAIPQLMHSLTNLEHQGIESILVLWAITRELRQLISMAAVIAKGDTVEKVLKDFHISYKKQPILKKILSRPQLKNWQALLIKAARLDLVIKGQLAGNSWDELKNIYLGLAGIELFREEKHVA